MIIKHKNDRMTNSIFIFSGKEVFFKSWPELFIKICQKQNKDGKVMQDYKACIRIEMVIGGNIDLATLSSKSMCPCLPLSNAPSLLAFILFLVKAYL